MTASIPQKYTFFTLVVLARPALTAFFAMGLVWGGFAACLPQIKAALNVHEGTLGLLMMGTPLAGVLAIAMAPVIAPLLGRFSLPLSVFFLAIAASLVGLSHNLAIFVGAMMLLGAATGNADVLMNARVSMMENQTGASLMNLSYATYSLGMAVGAVLVGMVRMLEFSLSDIFAIIAILTALWGALSYEEHGQITGLSASKTEGQSPNLGLLPYVGGFVVMIAFLSENATESWSALHIEQTLGGSAQEGSFGPATLALTMVVARLAGQGLLTKISELKLLMAGALIAAFGALIVATAQTAFAAYGGFVTVGVGASVISPTALTMVGRLATPHNRARAVARATMLGYFGFFFGPPAVGLIAHLFGLRAAYLATAFALSMVIILAPLLIKLGRKI